MNATTDSRSTHGSPALVGTVCALLLAAVTSLVPAIASAQSEFMAQPGPDAAAISGRLGKPGSDLYAVEFVEINGRNIAGNRDYLWLKPGRYTIKVRMLVDDPPGMDFRRPERGLITGYNTIELELEPGKTYTILGSYDKARGRIPYRTILYKVTDNE